MYCAEETDKKNGSGGYTIAYVSRRDVIEFEAGLAAARSYSLVMI